MPKPDKKLDDEYFRVYITMGANPGTSLAHLWKEDQVLREAAVSRVSFRTTIFLSARRLN